MNNKDEFIKSFSQFTKISENKVKDYLENNSVRTLVEHPSTIDPTPNQLKNFENLIKFNNLFTRLSKYQEYKFEKTNDMVDFLNSHFESKYDKEHFIVSFLDNENKLLGIETISIGTLNASIVHPRDVFKQALHYSSNRIVLSHNHPSGDPTPSNEDFNITKRLEEAGKLLNIKVLDHIIIARDQYYSFEEEGNLSVDYNILETKNVSHKNIYNQDNKNIIELLNKFTKIPKKTLNNILKENNINDLIKRPQDYLIKTEEIEKVNMLKEFKEEYISGLTKQEFKMSQPDSAKNYIDNRYSSNDEVNVILFLNTKNIVIESKIIPKNLSEEQEFKFIMENAILHNSNSYILGTKNGKSKQLDTFGSKERENRILNLEQKSNLFGIKLLDNIEIIGSRSNSFKEMKIIKESPISYSSVKKEKIPMSERFANAKTEANKRNNNQVLKPAKLKEKER